MSFNLVFDRGEETIRFPFQTPSKLTMAVLELKTNKERSDAIRKYLVENCMDWDDKEYIEEKMKVIDKMLNDPTMELSYT
jgi:hypothetical protein